MRSRVAAAAGLILVLSICGSRVDAAPDDDSEARSHYAAALQHIVRGAHDEALHELQASYALAPYPGTLYRIAQCEDLLGRTDEAIADYRRFAETAKNPTRRAAALARVEALKLATAAAKARAAPPATVGTVTAPAPATQLAARLPPPSAPR